jgi:hypothetical protein
MEWRYITTVKSFSNIGPWNQCYKIRRYITAIILTLLYRVKIPQYITAILGLIMLYNIGYTYTFVIYYHSIVITKVI